MNYYAQMLNCISGMVEKTQRAISILQQRQAEAAEQVLDDADTGSPRHGQICFSIAEQNTVFGRNVQRSAQLMHGIRVGFARLIVSTPAAAEQG